MTTQVDDWIGRKLKGRTGTYTVRSLLGAGGMASVYLGEDQNRREVALKIPREAIVQEEGFGGRFLREVRLLLQFDHPHVLKVLDIGEEGQSPFVVLQYLALGSLRHQQPCEEKSGRSFPMRPDEITQWLGPVAAALDYVHKEGFVHRDVKPENIMFDADGNPYLGDFGIIKARADGRRDTPETIATGAGLVLGTPNYMAPEVLMAERYDGRADQYSLAITVYELLAARLPFTGEPPVVFVGHMTKQPPKISEFVKGFPKAIEEVVLRGLSKKASDRYSDCRAFARAFEAAAKANPPPKPVSKARPSSPDINLGSKATIGVVCPHCQETAQLPHGVQSRTLRCARCRKVFSTSEGGAKRFDSAPTSKQDQAKLETRTEERRRGSKDRSKANLPAVKEPSKSSGMLLKVLMFVSWGLFAFWFFIGILGAILGANTLAVVAFVLTLPFLIGGIVCTMLLVHGSHQRETVQELCRTCEQALVERRYDDVIRDATKAIKLDGHCALAFMQRGFAHAKLQDFRDALADLDRAIQLDSTLSDAYAARAYVHRSRGDEDYAKADEKKANELKRR